MRAASTVAFVFLLGCVPSFTGFDVGTRDLGVQDAEVLDAPKINLPPWKSCADWNACEERKVELIGEMNNTLGTGGLDIAVSGGEVAVAWQHFLFPDHAILKTQIIGGRPDSFDRGFDSFSGGEVNLVPVSGGFEVVSVFTEPVAGVIEHRALIGGVLSPGREIADTSNKVRLSAASRSDGSLVVLFYDQEALRFASAASTAARDEWEVKNVRVERQSVASSGSVALVVDNTDTQRALYNFESVLAFSRASSTAWGFHSTLDTRVSGVEGVGVAADIFDGRVSVVFFESTRSIGQITLGSLRFSRDDYREFSLFGELPSTRDAPSDYPLALSVDAAGRIYVAVAVQGSDMLWTVYLLRETTPETNDFQREVVFAGIQLRPKVAMTLVDELPRIVFSVDRRLQHARVNR